MATSACFTKGAVGADEVLIWPRSAGAAITCQHCHRSLLQENWSMLYSLLLGPSASAASMGFQLQLHLAREAVTKCLGGKRHLNRMLCLLLTLLMMRPNYRSLLASRSDSNSVKMSPEVAVPASWMQGTKARSPVLLGSFMVFLQSSTEMPGDQCMHATVWTAAVSASYLCSCTI